MLGQPKPLASLSSGLLARKGGARPAMRPQAFTPVANPAQALDDLGWNDMGAGDPAPAPQPVAAPPPAPVPQVLVEREALTQGFEPLAFGERPVETPATVRPVSVATAVRLRRETAHVAKSAFTLRLDAERHLRLRLASALTNKSAQVLVTQAVDQLLASLPDVDALVAQLPPATRTRRKGK
jgi:hypothetical protein